MDMDINTRAEVIAATLDQLGVMDANEIADVLSNALQEFDEKQLAADLVTPTEGAMDDKLHTAFILRIFLYWIVTAPNRRMAVDLRNVKEETKGWALQVRMEGPAFEARAIKSFTMDTNIKGLAN